MLHFPSVILCRASDMRKRRLVTEGDSIRDYLRGKGVEENDNYNTTIVIVLWGFFHPEEKVTGSSFVSSCQKPSPHLTVAPQPRYPTRLPPLATPIGHTTMPGYTPPNFASITYEIKFGLPIPFSRWNQDPNPLAPQQNPRYPIHSPYSITYNLFTALDKMKPREYIEFPNREAYEYGVTVAQAYASKIRTRRHEPVQMYLRAEFNKNDQIGRIWRRG